MALPWVGVGVVALAAVARHMHLMPVGNDWNDTFVYARAASEFLSHPSHLFDGAREQYTSDVARAAYIYPPSGLIAFVPLVPLTRTMGLAWTASLWSWIDTAAMLAGLILIPRQLGLRGERLGWAMLVVTISGPLLIEVSSGQVQGVVILLLALSWRSWPRPSSGLFLGLALAVKPISPLLLVAPLLLRRPRVTGIAAMTLLALNLAFLPLIGSDATSFYLFHYLPFLQGHVTHDVANLSLANLLQTWIGGRSLLPRDANGISPLHAMLLADVLLWAIRAALLLLWARELWRNRRPAIELFIITLAMVPLLSGMAWPHYYVFILPAVLLLLASPSPSLRKATWVGALLILFNGEPSGLYPTDITDGGSLYDMFNFVHSEIMPVVTVGLVAGLLLRPISRAAPDAAATPRTAIAGHHPEPMRGQPAAAR
jgi:hypothetical protein